VWLFVRARGGVGQNSEEIRIKVSSRVSFFFFFFGKKTLKELVESRTPFVIHRSHVDE
jgi:hypothetical protein